MATLDYDDISETYGDDWCGLRARSRETVVDQVARLCPNIDTALDCAIGHGEFWEALQAYSAIEACVGNDLSTEMLEAAQKLPLKKFEGVQGDAQTLDRRLNGRQFGLVVSHFLYDYCPVGSFLPILRSLTETSGILSSLTTVKSQYDTEFWKQIERSALLRKVGNVDESIRVGGTPESHAHHIGLIEETGFEVVSEEELVIPIVAQSSEDVWAAAYRSGWGLGGLSKLGASRRWLLRQALRVSDLPMMGVFPFEMNVRFSSVCAKAVLI